MVGIRKQLIRNVFSSWFAHLVRIVITFFFVPYIAAVLGDARYGVWVIAFQTIAYFSLLDAGLTSAVTRYVSRFLANHEFERINRVLNTANLLYFIVGGLVLLGVWGFVELFFGYLNIPDAAFASEGKRALMVLGAYMAFNFVAMPFGNSLGAFHRYDITNALTIIEEVLRFGIMVFLLSRGHGLVALALAMVLLTIVKHLVGAGLLLRFFPEVNVGRKYVEKDTARSLLGYSKISLGISLCWLVLFNSDAFILGLIGSSAAAGIYHPGAQLMRYLRHIAYAVTTPLIPAVSHKEATGEWEPLRRLYLKAVRYGSYGAFAVAIGIVAYAPAFVNLWLPPEFADTSRVMQILVIGTAFLLPQFIGHAVLMGIERHGRLLWVLSFEAALKLVLAIFLTETYGLIGMAAAVAIPQVLVFTALYPALVSRALSLSVRSVLLLSARSILFALVLVAPVTYGVHWAIDPFTWTRLAVSAVIILIPVLAGAWLIAEPEDRDWLRRLLS